MKINKQAADIFTKGFTDAQKCSLVCLLINPIFPDQFWGNVILYADIEGDCNGKAMIKQETQDIIQHCPPMHSQANAVPATGEGTRPL